jgi:hypothetical protein
MAYEPRQLPGNAGVPAGAGDHHRHVHRANVIGPAAQGIDLGQLDELVAAIDSGMAYCNIHSSRWAAGEARGQLGPGAAGT